MERYQWEQGPFWDKIRARISRLTEGGIYMIRNVGAKGIYVGCTQRTPKRRWVSHRNLLRAGKHHTAMLQQAWDKDGEEAFEFVMLEAIPHTYAVNMAVRERYWIDHYEGLGWTIYNTKIVAPRGY